MLSELKTCSMLGVACRCELFDVGDALDDAAGLGNDAPAADPGLLAAMAAA